VTLRDRVSRRLHHFCTKFDKWTSLIVHVVAMGRPSVFFSRHPIDGEQPLLQLLAVERACAPAALGRSSEMLCEATVARPPPPLLVALSYVFTAERCCRLLLTVLLPVSSPGRPISPVYVDSPSRKHQPGRAARSDRRSRGSRRHTRDFTRVTAGVCAETGPGVLSVLLSAAMAWLRRISCRTCATIAKVVGLRSLVAERDTRTCTRGPRRTG